MKYFFPLVILTLFPACAFAQFEYRSDWNRLPTTFKPYVVKLMTPDGINILRDAPHDHSHHHALMFAIKVDDVNCWEEYNPKDFGRQETTSLEDTLNGVDVTKKVETTLTWSNGVGQPLVQEKRIITARPIGGATVLDWTSVFTLPPDKETAKLGGSHYHGLGMRFLESMDKDGRYFNSEKESAESEEVNGAKLTRCHWMAYTAKAKGKSVTVAIFDAKDNPRQMLAFTMGGNGREFTYLSATCNLYREPLTLTTEKPISFRYGVALWDGEQSHETVDKVYQQWKNGREN